MNGNIIEQRTYQQQVIAEWYKIVNKLNGLSRAQVKKLYFPLEDSIEEETDMCYFEVDINDCKWIQMVYVDFDEDWKNAKVSPENVTVYPADKMVGEPININEVIKKEINDAMQCLCDWLNKNGAEDAVIIWDECVGDDGNVYEYCDGLSFDIVGNYYVNPTFELRFHDDIEDYVKRNEFDEWFNCEMSKLAEGYNPDDETLMFFSGYFNINTSLDEKRKMLSVGVGRILEAFENVKGKLKKFAE